jgi:hypothetical protein
MTKWDFVTDTVAPGEDRYTVIRKRCEDGWEPFCIELDANGWREIYFKRPITS